MRKAAVCLLLMSLAFGCEEGTPVQNDGDFSEISDLAGEESLVPPEDPSRYIGRFYPQSLGPGGGCTGTLIAALGDDGCVLTASHCFQDSETPEFDCVVEDQVFELPLSPGDYQAFDIIEAACRPPGTVANPFDVALVKIDLAGLAVSNLPRLVSEPHPTLEDNMILGEGGGYRKTNSVVTWQNPSDPADPNNGLPALWEMELFSPPEGPFWVAVVAFEPPSCYAPWTFHYNAGTEEVRQASVSGSFNHWLQWPLSDVDGDNVWTATFDLELGIHLYKFVIDDDWRQDPENTEGWPDGYGGLDSLLTIDCDATDPDPLDWYRVRLGDSGGPWFYYDGNSLNVFGTTTGAGTHYEDLDPAGTPWSAMIAAEYSENANWIADMVDRLGCGSL